MTVIYGWAWELDDHTTIALDPDPPHCCALHPKAVQLQGLPAVPGGLPISAGDMWGMGVESRVQVSPTEL